jgi:HSP20 family molecular chaperone IbpA
MADSESKALRPKEKREVTTPAEHTKPGLTFTPAVDIFETDSEITLLADMPGVKPKDLTIDLRDDVLSLAGEIDSPEAAKEMEVLREYEMGTYVRQFTLSELIDQAKIEADLKDGVLRLSLPKVEPAQPRKIKVKSA